MVVLVVVAYALAACGSASTPQPASSIRFVAGETFASGSTEVAGGRVLIALVSDGASADQIRRLGERIAALPQVQRYAFMSKDDCLEFFRGRFGQSPSPGLVLLAGFWMLLQAADEAAAVQQALDGDPAVQHGDTPSSGVMQGREFYLMMAGG